jgi:hypothetical protein
VRSARSYGLLKGRNQMNTDNDPRFELLPQVLKIVVPAKYEHDTQLASFEKQYRKACSSFNEARTDANFANVGSKLLPGHAYSVKQYRVVKPIFPSECLAFLRLKEALFVSAQGESVLFDQKRRELKRGCGYFSLDEEANLPIVDGVRMIPYFQARAGRGFSLHLKPFSKKLIAGRVLLCVKYDTLET